MKEIYIHIGYPKTGTSFLRYEVFDKHEKINYLGKNKDMLYSDKILSKLIKYITNTDEIKYCEQYAKELFNEVESFSEDKVNLISQEGLVSNNTSVDLLRKTANLGPDVLRMHERLSSVFKKVKIIVTLREQRKILESVYSTELNGHESKNFFKYKDWIDYSISCENSVLDFFKYYRFLIKLQEIYGQENIKVLLFEDFKEEKTQFFTELFTFMNLSYDSSSNPEQGEKKVKERITKKIYYLRKIKSLLGINTNLYLLSENLLPRSLHDFLINYFKSGKKLNYNYSNEQIEKLENIFKFDNEKLSKLLNKDLKKLGYF